MLEGDSITTVQEFLTADAFYLDTHRIIYRAIEEPLLGKQAGGPAYSHRETQTAEKTERGGRRPFSRPGDAEGGLGDEHRVPRHHHRTEIRAAGLIRASTEIQRRSYDESTDVTDLIDYAEAEIFKVSEGHIKRDIQSASLVFDKAMKAIEEAHAQGGTMNGVPTGFTRLDQAHAGMAALRPHHHRSPSLDGQDRLRPLMARNMAIDHEKPVAFFSLEMSSVRNMMRLIVAESGLSSADVRSGKPDRRAVAPPRTDDTHPAHRSAFHRRYAGPLHLRARSKARRLKAQHDIR